MFSYLSPSAIEQKSPPLNGPTRNLVHSNSIRQFASSGTGLTCLVRGVNSTPQTVSIGKKQNKKDTGPPRPSGIEKCKLWNTNAGIPPFLKSPFIVTNKPVYIAEMVAPSTLVTLSSTVPTLAGVNFTVGSINQISSLTNLYDQYRIVRIEVWIQIEPSASTVNVGQYNATNIATAIDYDSSAAPGSFAGLCDYENSIVSPLIDGHYHSFTPKVAMAAYTGLFDGYESVEAPWIDASSTTVQHYGLLFAAEVALATNPVKYWYRLHTQWRALR